MALEGSKHTITTIVIQIVPAPISRSLRICTIKNNVFSHSAFTRDTLTRPIIARCVCEYLFFLTTLVYTHQA